MFRQTTCSLCLRTFAALFTFSVCSVLATQNAAAGSETVDFDPKLWQLLSDWSEASSGIKKLSGKHQRHIYDNTFKIEKISTGEFWYESPDKGRIDVSPVKINAQMQAARQKADAQVRRSPDGTPFKLQSDDAERWMCDGKDVYDIDDEAKEARVAPLPPQLRGENIMNSPLPFLFGLPPQKAVKRFKMEIVKDYRPKYNVVQLKAEPLLRSDAANWSEAKILLDTNTFLPTAVSLIDPPRTGESVYKFSELKVNDSNFLRGLLGKDPWDPKLKGYKVTVIKPQQQPTGNENAPQPIVQRPLGAAQGGNPAGGGQIMVPPVVGLHYKKAQELLARAGIPKDRIRQLRGGPAPTKEQTYVVKAQQPKANTPLAANGGVTIMIYEQTKAAAAVGQPQARVAANR